MNAVYIYIYELVCCNDHCSSGVTCDLLCFIATFGESDAGMESKPLSGIFQRPTNKEMTIPHLLLNSILPVSYSKRQSGND